MEWKLHETQSPLTNDCFEWGQSVLYSHQQLNTANSIHLPFQYTRRRRHIKPNFEKIQEPTDIDSPSFLTMILAWSQAWPCYEFMIQMSNLTPPVTIFNALLSFNNKNLSLQLTSSTSGKAIYLPLPLCPCACDTRLLFFLEEADGGLYCKIGCFGSYFMGECFHGSQEDVPQALFRFLQPPCFYDSCNSGSDLVLTHCGGLALPSLSSGLKIISKAGISFSNGDLFAFRFSLWIMWSTTILKMQMQTLAVTLAYLIYDLICCLLEDKRVNLDNSIHHLVSIVGIGAGLFYEMVTTKN